MARRRVFYGYDLDADTARVQLLGRIESLDNVAPLAADDWKALSDQGNDAIKDWINRGIGDCHCVVVLIGANTAHHKWVMYEIERAWEEKKGLFGIYIHNLRDATIEQGMQGPNPFSPWIFEQSGDVAHIACYNPNPTDAYADVARNIDKWVETAIAQRK